MVNLDALQSPIQTLVREQDLLKKILHRNSNQHACTKLFGYLKRVHKGLVTLRLDSVSDLASNELLGSSSKKRKLREFELESVQVNVAKGREIMDRCSKVAFAGIRSFTLLQQYLREKLFLPLYTTLLALTASILHSVCTLMVHFDDHTQMMAASISDRLASRSFPVSVELARMFANMKSDALVDHTAKEVVNDIMVVTESSSPFSSSPPVRIEKGTEGERDIGDVVVNLASFRGSTQEKEEKEEKEVPAPKKAKVKDKSGKRGRTNKPKEAMDEIDEIFASVSSNL